MYRSPEGEREAPEGSNFSEGILFTLEHAGFPPSRYGVGWGVFSLGRNSVTRPKTVGRSQSEMK